MTLAQAGDCMEQGPLNPTLPWGACLCSWMCKAAMAGRQHADACPGNCQNPFQGKQLPPSGQFSEREERLPAQSLRPVHSPVVMKRPHFWKMLLSGCLFSPSTGRPEKGCPGQASPNSSDVKNAEEEWPGRRREWPIAVTHILSHCNFFYFGRVIPLYFSGKKM